MTLRLDRRSGASVLACVAAAVCAFTGARAQSPPPADSRRFEVASIKRSAPNQDGSRSSAGLGPGGRFVMTNGPVRVLLNMAYPSQTFEIIGAPDWVTHEHYDVIATTTAPVGRDALAAMLRKLLAERFNLKAHFTDVERPSYDLRVVAADGTLGPKIRRPAVDCATIAPPTAPPPRTGPPGACLTRSARGAILSGGMTMKALATGLSGPSGRLVVDRTGLDGYYEVDLQYALDLGPSDANTTIDTPSLFTAVREQLGLALRPSTARVQALVIDAIDRPSEN